MVTVALSDKLYVAYDATNGGLYKAWSGGVKFDGAVYTTAHGPQPTSLGATYLTGPTDRPVWFVDGKPTNPRYRGYRLTGGQVHLHLEFQHGGKTTHVWETPEAEGGRLQRSFRVQGNAQLSMALPTAANGASVDSVAKYADGREVKFVAGTKSVNLPVKDGMSWHWAPSTAPVQLLRWHRPIAQQGQEEVRSPGVSMRIYHTQVEMSALPKLVAGQTPNVSKVIPIIDLRKAEDFGDLNFNFIVHLDGFINVKETGDYTFALASDDGSRLLLDGKKVIDHDGLHSEEPKQGRVKLAPGAHPFFIEYFQSGGDQVLRLEWMKPGSSSFEVVPAEAFTCIDSVRVTAPGKKLILDVTKEKRPGDGIPLTGVHPSYDLATVRPKDFKPRVGGMDFLPDGRMVICNWEPDGGVYVLSGVQDKDPRNIKVKRIAFGLAEPLGIKVVGKDIYVLQKQELTKLIDLDGDEIIDEYYCVANGWGVTANFHEFAFGLVYKNGYFYGNLATAINPGGASTQPQNPDRGKVVKINARTGDFKLVADGLRTPNGIGLGYKNEIYLMDNQGDWLPSSKLLHLKEGAFYGSRSVNPVGRKDTPEMPPVVWLPQGEIGNSPSQPSYINDGPYKGQMVHGDVTHGGVKRVFVEEVGGQLQGCVFRFTQGLEAGINRLVWGPDGSLYVGGIGSTGNWGQDGKERFGLQRLKYTGASTFEMLAVRMKSNGLEVQLTEPVAEGSGIFPDLYEVRQWRYVPTATYGGPKVDEELVPVKSVTISKDRTRIFVEAPGIKPGHVVYIKLDSFLPSKSGKMLWSTEGWYTANKIPSAAGKPSPVEVPSTIEVSMAEKAEGFVQLGPGAWKAFRGDAVPSAWAWQDGVLTMRPGKGKGGDIATKEQFDNFELRLDWNISTAGNSGVIYRASETKPYSYMTGVEYQILDNLQHPDGQSPLTSAGSAYAMVAPSQKACREAGQWNSTRIVVRGTKVEHWLNDFKIVEYDSGSAAWKERLKQSKFRGMPEYSTLTSGLISLQDHGNEVSFRNIRIKRLDP
jgi:cytochrome c